MLSTPALGLLATVLCTTLSSAIPAPQASGTTPPASGTAPPASGTPSPSSGTPPQASGTAPSSSGYWFADISHAQDTVWQNNDTSYTVFRNVMDYGAKGDGSTDDAVAINNAMADGNRCGGGPNVCASSSITPAIIYFPPGTYMVSTPINMYYYTQMVGDALQPPTIKALTSFTGMAVIDADPYDDGVNWYVNQNNFFRQVRNFVLDITDWGGNGMTGAAIHWQVAQATSLQNIVFELSSAAGNTQQGIFMDNGSGGFFADLTFNNGNQGAFLGSQQFTTRNLTFNHCQTAIFMNWNWGWTLHGITVNGGTTAVDMSNDPTNQTVGSVLLSDSTISGVQYGVRFAYQNSSANVYPTGGTLIIDNVDMRQVQVAAVVDVNNATILGPSMIDAWASGMGYNMTTRQGTDTILQGNRQENAISGAHKDASLLSGGNIFSQSRPQYESYPLSSFVAAKGDAKCAGDGTTDDTACINSLLKQVAGTGNIAYFEHGAYLVSGTITVPPDVMMTGEIWPLIVADGSSANFSDASNPTAVFQVGQSGQTGSFEISDFIFETKGSAPGAIMIEWNLKSNQGDAGMWDTHVRIGGSAGTELEMGQCAAQQNSTGYPLEKSCEGVFLMFHATNESSGVYLENNWFWVADHDFDEDNMGTEDADPPPRLTIYSARGVLIQSQGPVWLWGTASEHSLLYNYQFDGVQALYSGLMQSETPYMQPYPLAPEPFQFNNQYDDPLFSICSNNTNASSSSPPCKVAWGLRILDSKNVVIYATGFYSFFQSYQQTCDATRNCQEDMIHIQNSQVDMYTVNTFAAVNMIVDDGVGSVTNADNLNWFCGTVSYYFTGY